MIKYGLVHHVYNGAAPLHSSRKFYLLTMDTKKRKRSSISAITKSSKRPKPSPLTPAPKRKKSQPSPQTSSEDEVGPGLSDEENAFQDEDHSEDERDNETAAQKRLRLAKGYLESLEKKTLRRRGQ
jgi:ribosomal RNA-processing protein 9